MSIERIEKLQRELETRTYMRDELVVNETTKETLRSDAFTDLANRECAPEIVEEYDLPDLIEQIDQWIKEDDLFQVKWDGTSMVWGLHIGQGEYALFATVWHIC